MAPDINTLPPSSPRPAVPRRTSMPPPPPPPPLSHNAVSQRSPLQTSNEQIPLPIRHPRPLTAAELYLTLEKEQENVVNRLTRELTALRAQTASVASNASSSTSTSASLLPVDISDTNAIHQLTGATHPTPSRRHRSSSSLSARSISNAPSTSTTQAQAGSTTTQSQASAARAAAAGQPGQLSRQPSITTSGHSTPARQSLDIPRPPPTTSYTLPHRPSLSRDQSYISQTTNASSTAAHAGTPQPLSPTQSITSQHYTETAAYRNEMETVKAENEALRQRVRALERALRARRRDSSNSDVAWSDISSARVPRERDSLTIANSTNSGLVSPEPRSAISPGASAVSPGVAAWAADGGVGGVAPPRERSESQSTTASSRRGTAVANAEDEVRLGESAGSVGIGRGV